jgi:hypothetical protein
MNYHRRNFKYNTTTSDERHKRVLLVLATTGLTGLFGAVYGIMVRVFNFAYLTKNNWLPIGSEHILTVMLLTSALLIFLSGLLYCYFEYLTFYKEEPNKQRIKNENADIMYRRWLDCMQLSAIILVAFIVLSQIFSLSLFQIIVIVLISAAVFCLLRWILEKIRRMKRYQALLTKINAAKLYKVAIIILYLFIFGACLRIGLSSLGSGLEKKLTVNFHNDNPMPMEIILINKNPVDVKIQVTNSKFSNYSLPLKKGFNSIVFEPPIILDKTQYSIGGKKVDVNKSYREYRKVVNLFGQLTEGKNEIELTITTNDKYKYVLTNQVYVTKGKAEFIKQSFSTKL